MRGARAFSEPFAARVFNEGLPELVSKIKNENTEENARQVESKHSKHGTLIATAHHSPLTFPLPLTRQHALRMIESGLTCVTIDESVHAIDRLQMTSAITAVVQLCEDRLVLAKERPSTPAVKRRQTLVGEPVEEDRPIRMRSSKSSTPPATIDVGSDPLLCHGLVVLANLCWCGGSKLCHDAKGTPLLLKVLKPDSEAELLPLRHPSGSKIRSHKACDVSEAVTRAPRCLICVWTSRSSMWSAKGLEDRLCARAAVEGLRGPV